MCVFRGWDEHEKKGDPSFGALIILLIVLFIIFYLPIAAFISELAKW